MALRWLTRRAYVEAWHRQHHGGVASPGWRPGEIIEIEVQLWMETFDIAKLDNISPWDALLLAVNRRAARVRWVDAILQEMLEQHRRTCEAILADDPTAAVYPDLPPAEVRVWMAESRNEERLLTRAAKMAVDAGVADAQIRRIEMEGRLTTDALIAGLDALELTPDQRLKALSTMHRTLMQLPAGASAAAPTVPGYVIDADVVDDVVDDTPNDDGLSAAG